MDLYQFQSRLRRFSDDRDWGRHHTPHNLAQALSVEAGELLECFLWGERPTDIGRERIAEECADVMIYLLQLCDSCDIDLETAVDLKIRSNGQRYPAQARLPI